MQTAAITARWHGGTLPLRRGDRYPLRQAAGCLRVSVREHRELEAGEHVPDFEAWGRICKLYGWPQTFMRGPKVIRCIPWAVVWERREKRGRMFAVVVREGGEREGIEGSSELLEANVLPRVKQAPVSFRATG